MSFFYVWGVLGGAIVVRILCWDKSLAVLVLPYRRPTPRFAVGWVVGTLARVGTLALFR